jgi:hypothetical protein
MLSLGLALEFASTCCAPAGSASAHVKSAMTISAARRHLGCSKIFHRGEENIIIASF